MKSPLLALAGVCLWTFLAGCGSDADGGSCANTPACGGKVVGTWKLASSCMVPTSQPMAACAGATSTTLSSSMTGTFTYKADLSYSWTFAASSAGREFLPQSCFGQGGLPATCEELNALYESTLTANITASCTADGAGNCTCDVMTTVPETTQSGTYSTNAAGLLTQSPTGGSSSLLDYCVRGNTLTLSPYSDTRFMSDFMGTITLSKE